MWLEDYRKKYGLECDDMARRVNQAGKKLDPPLECTVTDTLIHVLEISKVPRTHPRIADAIALACGATEEQRNSIVDKKHHGTRTPIKCDWRNKPMVGHPNPNGLDKAVVKINKWGHLIARYSSIASAERYNDMTRDAIRARCQRKVQKEFVEGCDYTFRYADRWDKMTPAERLKDAGGDVDE